MAMLADSTTGNLTATSGEDDMDLVLSTDGLILSDYLTGLDADGLVKTGCTYDFETDGTVVQASTP